MSQPASTISKLEEEHIEPVARLFHEDMQALGEDTSLPRIEKLLRSVIEDDDDTSCCWVAATDEGNAPVGAILVNVYRSIKFGGRSLWIEGLYVAPEFRRRGIGRELVEHVIDWGEERPFLGVDLEAYQTNTPAAVLYRTLGFRRLGRARFSYDYEHAG